MGDDGELGGLALAMLPGEEAERRARRSGANPGPWSVGLGLLLFPVGLLLYVGRGLSFAASLNASLWGFLIWHLHPECWLWLAYAGNGLLRVAGWLTLRQPVGDPLVWIGYRLVGIWRRHRHENELEREFGPRRPDRAVVDPDGALVILSARDKPDWDGAATVRIEDRYFRMVRHEVRERSGRRVHAYVLEDLPPGEVIRGPVVSEARLPEGLDDPVPSAEWNPDAGAG